MFNSMVGHLLKWGAGVLFLGLLPGCSAFQYADLSAYPVEERTIFLQNFTNETFQAGMNISVTEALREELHRRGNLIPVNSRDKARFLVGGRILVYRKEGRLYDNYQNATRYELILSGRVEAREAQDQSILFSDQEIVTGLDFSVSEGYAESEDRAAERLSRIFARKVANALELDFISHYPLVLKSVQ